jgi:hypothetical protein
MKFKKDFLYKIKRTEKFDDVILVTKCDTNINANSLILGNDFNLYNMSTHYLKLILEAKEIGHKEDCPEYFI